MIKYLTRLLCLAFIGATLTASAQTRKTYDLQADFGLNYLQSKLQVKNLFADTNAAKTKYPAFWKYRALKGYRWGSFMALSAFDAAAGEATRQGHGGNADAMLNSYNDVHLPSGEYWQTIIFETRGGEIIGHGPGYVGTDGKNSDNTELVIWHELWQGDPLERHCIQTSPWALGKSNGYYSESGRIDNIAFNGRQNEFLSQKFNSTGLRLWYPGETYTIDRLYPTNFRTAGIEVFGATPLDAGDISVFDNVEAGVIFWSSGATVNWNLLSGDDNGAMFKCKHGYSDTGGGLINFGAIKMETAVASGDPANGTGRAWRDQVVGHIEGQFGVNIGVVSSYSSGRYNNAAFVVDTRSPYYPPQSSCLTVGAFRAKNFKYAVMQIGGGTGGLDACYYDAKGSLNARGFEWSSDDDGKGTLVWKGSKNPIAAKVPHSCTARVAGGTSPVTGCTAYREIADGPPRALAITYLDQITGTTPPPPTACAFAYSAWTTNCPGTQTRTYTATPTGCVGMPPADSLSRTCTVTPPPTSGGIDPADVLVVWNTADGATQAWATEYATAWGIPTSNVQGLNFGSGEDLTSSAVLASAKNAIDGKGKQYTVLAFARPSRYGTQSITSAVTFGARSVSSLTNSQLYGYTGLKPRTDKGVAPSFLLVDRKYIRRDAHGTKPTGQAILLLAKDQTGTPRGSARAGQTAPGLTVWDNRTYSGIGNGQNACNYISSDCWRADRRPGTTPIVAAYQSMYILGSSGSAVWAKGFYGDHVTSFGGYLPAGTDGLNSQGQTALTYHLDKGSSLSVGSVSEPWQGFGGSLAVQFVDASKFHPLFLGGSPVGVAAWSSVKCPDRMLFGGDGLTAPFK